MLLDDLRLEAAMPVARHLDGQLAELALELLAAEALTSIADRVGDRLMAVMAEMVSHLSIKGTLDQLLGELLDELVGTD